MFLVSGGLRGRLVDYSQPMILLVSLLQLLQFTIAYPSNPATCSFVIPEFPCQTDLTPSKQLDASKLRPQDVQFIIGMGDSITAGLFSTWSGDGRFEILNPKHGYKFAERRSLSWVTGADATVLSLFNLFKRYSPDLLGGSESFTKVRYDGVDVDSPDPDMNVAYTGATSDVLYKQVEKLIQVMQSFQADLTFRLDANRQTTLFRSVRLSAENTYTLTTRVGAKYLNLLIGANDACGFCKSGFIAEDYVKHVNNTIASLYDARIMTEFNVTNRDEANRTTIVRSPLYIGIQTLSAKFLSQLHHLSDVRKGCKLWQAVTRLCPCVLENGNRTFVRERLVDIGRVYNDGIKSIVQFWERQARKEKRNRDFKVQWFDALENLLLVPEIKQDATLDPQTFEKANSLLSSVDCFHPNRCLSESLAFGVWNQLFSNTKRSKDSLNFVTGVLESRTRLPYWSCPKRDTYLR